MSYSCQRSEEQGTAGKAYSKGLIKEVLLGSNISIDIWTGDHACYTLPESFFFLVFFVLRLWETDIKDGGFINLEEDISRQV